jgi:D-tyrosyl-tRNA(Tyr) deacylase
VKAVIQRVSEARVEVNGQVSGRIGPGLLVLLGIRKGDTEADAAYLADKVLGLRIFADAQGKMNLSLLDTGGELLIVSQFTLHGDVRKGRRPSFDAAAAPADAERLYSRVVELCRLRGVTVATGVFQAMMSVFLINDGPVTIICESPNDFSAPQ